MPGLEKEQILEALRTVQAPDASRDLVSLERIQNVAVCDGNVALRIAEPEADVRAREQLRGAVEAALHKLPGVQRVTIEFATDAPAGPVPTGPLPGVKNIIAVGAGKGGVGKSTVALMLAWGLRRAGHAVGLMDADVYGPSIPKLTGLEGAQVEIVPDPAGATAPDGKPLVRWMPPTADGVKVMSPGFAIEADQAAIMRGPMISNVFRQLMFDLTLWDELDYLIVDLPPGTGDIPLTLAQTIPQARAVAVVVATPQRVALLDAIKALEMYRKLNIDVVGLVENMSYFIAPDTGKEYDLFGKGGAAAAARDVDVPFLGSLPINVIIRESGDEGTPMRMFDEDAGLGQAVDAVVSALTAQVAAHQAARPGAVALSISDD